jgi:hypothetical protein
MAKVTDEEVALSQELAKGYVMLAMQQEPYIGVGALLLALATCGAASGIPRDNLAALFDKTLDEVYAAAADMESKPN